MKALLEVVESGAKSIEVAVMRRGRPMELIASADILEVCKAIESEKAEEGGAAAE